MLSAWGAFWPKEKALIDRYAADTAVYLRHIGDKAINQYMNAFREADVLKMYAGPSALYLGWPAAIVASACVEQTVPEEKSSKPAKIKVWPLPPEMPCPLEGTPFEHTCIGIGGALGMLSGGLVDVEACMSCEKVKFGITFGNVAGVEWEREFGRHAYMPNARGEMIASIKDKLFIGAKAGKLIGEGIAFAGSGGKEGITFEFEDGEYRGMNFTASASANVSFIEYTVDGRAGVESGPAVTSEVAFKGFLEAEH